MGFFFWRRKKRCSALDKIIAGIVIGGAIGSIVGKKLLEKRKEERGNGNEEDEPLEEEGEE